MHNPRFNYVVRRALEPLRWLIGRPRFAQLFKSRIPIVGRVHLALPGGRRLRLQAGRGDDVTTPLYWGGYEGFEHESLEAFRRLALQSTYIFDIGANVGIFSLVAAAANRDAKIWAFEPVPQVYRLMKGNARRNELENITPVRAALAQRSGRISLYVPHGATPSGARTVRLRKNRKPACVLRVKCLTGDRYMQEFKIPRLDLIKIDTETTEPEVFAGLRSTIERDGPAVLCEVLYGRTEQKLMEFFGPMGYRYWHLTDKGPIPRERIEGDPTYRFRNYLFCRGELPPVLLSPLTAAPEEHA